MTLKSTLVGLLAGALTLLTAAASSAVDKPKAPDAARIQEMARAAKTRAEHLEVAQLFEAQAATFDAKASTHEQEADRIAKRGAYNPMANKWPALAQGPAEFQRTKAMQARCAANESRERVAYHRQQAGLDPAATGAAGGQ